MIETLFYQCYYSYLKGEKENTEMYYSILRDEFKKKGRSDTLSKNQLKELKKVKISLENGNILKNEWINSSIPGENSYSDNKFISQREIVKKIHFTGFKDLKRILSPDLYLYNIEHPYGIYGKVDMLYMDNDTAYPIEVKGKRAKHDIIGQIAKYDIACKLRLHYKMYNKVRSATICSSYDSHVLKDLKRNGVITIAYHDTEEGFFIEKI